MIWDKPKSIMIEVEPLSPPLASVDLTTCEDSGKVLVVGC